MGFVRILLLALSLPFILGMAGCPNAFTEVADQSSTSALMYSAKRSIDLGDYDGALTTLNELTGTAATTTEARRLFAAAYSGKCGLNLIEAATSIADGLGSGLTLFQTLLSTYKNAGTTIAPHCISAEDQMKAISASEWTDDDYVFFAFLQLAKIGTLLARSGIDTNNDGNIDTPITFNACTNNGTHIVDSDVQHVASGIMQAQWALTQVGSGIADATMTAFSLVCTALNSAQAGFCDQLDESEFTGAEITIIRQLFLSNEIGFNTCNGSYASGASCLCL